MNQTVKQRHQILRAIASQAMLDRDLLPEFSSEVIKESNEIAVPANEHDPSTRDLRGLLWASIDNDDSRDLDQVSFAELAGTGVTRVLVAVADVDAFVWKSSAIDRHAQHNTT